MMVSPCCSTSASAVTVCSVGSPAGTISQTARGADKRETRSDSEDDAVAPPRAMACTASALRSHTTTSCPPATRRRVMFPPIRPRPIRPICIARSLAPFVDLPDARDVPAAFERRCEPGAHDREGERFGDCPLTERDHVRVVVRAVPHGDLLAPADAASDAADAVRDHRFAVAGTAEHDAALESPLRDRLSYGSDEIRVIDGRV